MNEVDIEKLKRREIQLLENCEKLKASAENLRVSCLYAQGKLKLINKQISKMLKDWEIFNK